MTRKKREMCEVTCEMFLKVACYSQAIPLDRVTLFIHYFINRCNLTRLFAEKTCINIYYFKDCPICLLQRNADLFLQYGKTGTKHSDPLINDKLY